MDRFEFQRYCVEKTKGKVLNAGCKEDPAHLKSQFPNFVTNLDRQDFDEDIFKRTGEKKPIPVDVVHNMFDIPWPFQNEEFELVVLGDVLEDLPDNGCQANILKEVGRISQKVCITTPNDGPWRDLHHLTHITEKRLKDWLVEANFDIIEFHTVDYTFVPEGYLVLAKYGRNKSV